MARLVRATCRRTRWNRWPGQAGPRLGRRAPGGRADLSPPFVPPLTRFWHVPAYCRSTARRIALRHACHPEHAPARLPCLARRCRGRAAGRAGADRKRPAEGPSAAVPRELRRGGLGPSLRLDADAGGDDAAGGGHPVQDKAGRVRHRPGHPAGAHGHAAGCFGTEKAGWFGLSVRHGMGVRGRLERLAAAGDHALPLRQCPARSFGRSAMGGEGRAIRGDENVFVPLQESGRLLEGRHQRLKRRGGFPDEAGKIPETGDRRPVRGAGGGGPARAAIRAGDCCRTRASVRCSRAATPSCAACATA